VNAPLSEQVRDHYGHRPLAEGEESAPLWRQAWAAILNVLPRGGVLPEEAWQKRHRGITALLWAHVVALPLIGAVRHHPPGEVLLAGIVVGVFAVGASTGRLSVTTRSAMSTIGLVSSSAILVLFFDGLIEMHFHYFVIVAVVALYQAWRPYLIALGFVLLQHTIIGMVAPHQVYDHTGAQAHPWTWALIHGGFVLAESVTCLMYWRVSEDSLDGEREARVRLEKAHLDLIKAQALSGVGSWEWDISSNRVSWSDQLYTLTGLDRDTFVPSVASLLEVVHPEERDRVDALIAQAVTDETGLEYESRLVRADGKILAFHALSDREVAAGRLVRMFGTVHDVTERKALQEEIERLAFHDPLTGLANRRLFLDRLNNALARQIRTGRGCGVLFMDLDDFKKVNDAFGHGVGDDLLCVVAERLLASVRPADTVARLGGDEFAILLEDVNLEASTRLAERLETELRRPTQLQGAERSIRGSIGIAMAEGKISADEILRNADAAMYAVKIGGKNSHKVFPSTLSSS
jgi:diguanylate cyclase (GGDEF)-like protein/PAS domain S-box-containing protein